MTDDVLIYAAALLLHPSKHKSYIEECWPEEWHEGAFTAASSLRKEEYNHDVEIQLSEQSLAASTLLMRKKDTMLSKMRLELRNKTMARARGKDDFDSFISEAPIALAEGTTPFQWRCSQDVIVVTETFPEGKQAVAGSVFNATSQFGNAMGLAIMQIVTTLVTKQYAGTKPAEEALLQGYKASFWAMFSFMILCAFIEGVGLRKAGKMGLEQEEKMERD
ncbi:hypothetical protein IL306_009117 [Fusarium sp. DS 682]|nr:hypothetical protein IL306_009117 [Fusarium sp. DS 682]